MTFAQYDDFHKNSWLAERFQEAVSYLAEAEGALHQKLEYLLTKGSLRDVGAKDFDVESDRNLWFPIEELRRTEAASEYDDGNPVSRNLAGCTELEVFILANHVVELLFSLTAAPTVMPYYDFTGESHVAA